MGDIMKVDIVLTGSPEFPFHKYECMKVALLIQRISEATEKGCMGRNRLTKSISYRFAKLEIPPFCPPFDFLGLRKLLKFSLDFFLFHFF